MQCGRSVWETAPESHGFVTSNESPEMPLATLHCARGPAFEGRLSKRRACVFEANDGNKVPVSPPLARRCPAPRRNASAQCLNAGPRRGTKLAASRPCIAGRNRRLRVWTRLRLSLTIVIRTIPSPRIASSQTTPQTK